eukprot:scaffold78034_cov60-Phaeocystis_antarctica.AAC.1
MADYPPHLTAFRFPKNGGALVLARMAGAASRLKFQNAAAVGSGGETHRDAAPAIRASNKAPAPRLLAAMRAAMRSAAAHAAAAASSSMTSISSSSDVPRTDGDWSLETDAGPGDSSVNAPSLSTFAQGDPKGDSLRPSAAVSSAAAPASRSDPATTALKRRVNSSSCSAPRVDRPWILSSTTL